MDLSCCGSMAYINRTAPCLCLPTDPPFCWCNMRVYVRASAFFVSIFKKFSVYFLFYLMSYYIVYVCLKTCDLCLFYRKILGVTSIHVWYYGIFVTSSYIYAYRERKGKRNLRRFAWLWRRVVRWCLWSINLVTVYRVTGVRTSRSEGKRHIRKRWCVLKWLYCVWPAHIQRCTERVITPHW